MSLFDVIKYPISDKITVAELETIPSPVYDHWCRNHGYNSAQPRVHICLFLIYDNTVDYDFKIVQLRRLIAEYEPL